MSSIELVKNRFQYSKESEEERKHSIIQGQNCYPEPDEIEYSIVSRRKHQKLDDIQRSYILKQIDNNKISV